MKTNESGESIEAMEAAGMQRQQVEGGMKLLIKSPHILAMAQYTFEMAWMAHHQKISIRSVDSPSHKN